jgi:hypothetical protein
LKLLSESYQASLAITTENAASSHPVALQGPSDLHHQIALLAKHFLSLKKPNPFKKIFRMNDFSFKPISSIAVTEEGVPELSLKKEFEILVGKKRKIAHKIQNILRSTLETPMHAKTYQSANQDLLELINQTKKLELKIQEEKNLGNPKSYWRYLDTIQNIKFQIVKWNHALKQRKSSMLSPK